MATNIKNEDTIMMTTNNKKEDTKMTTNKKAKLTIDEAMTIINNASAENKIKITFKTKHTNYAIKIDDTNYIVYTPDDEDQFAGIDYVKKACQFNTSDTYNVTVVSKSTEALWDAQYDIVHKIEARDHNLEHIPNANINIDILYDMIDTSNKVELDDKKLRNMLTKARFTGCLYDLSEGFVCGHEYGYGYTINNNNIIWYVPDDCQIGNDDLCYIMQLAHWGDERHILDHLDRNQIDRCITKNEITLNVHVVSNKKVFDTDFIIYISDPITSQHIFAYIHAV